MTGGPLALSGIVLAGGASRRFPPNKLAETLEGEPLLWHALRSVAAVADEIVVVVSHAAPPPALPALPGLRVARDALPAGGPLVGLAAGLASATRPLALLVAGDAPRVPPALLADLAEAARAGRADLVTLASPMRTSVLPSACRVESLRGTVGSLVGAGERRLRALLDAVRTEVLPESWWRARDPQGGWLHDVDRPEDIAPSSRARPVDRRTPE